MSKTRDELALEYAGRNGFDPCDPEDSFKAGWDARESELTRLREQVKELREFAERFVLPDGVTCSEQEYICDALAREALRRAGGENE